MNLKSCPSVNTLGHFPDNSLLFPVPFLGGKLQNPLTRPVQIYVLDLNSCLSEILSDFKSIELVRDPIIAEHRGLCMAN